MEIGQETQPGCSCDAIETSLDSLQWLSNNPQRLVPVAWQVQPFGCHTIHRHQKGRILLPPKNEWCSAPRFYYSTDVSLLPKCCI